MTLVSSTHIEAAVAATIWLEGCTLRYGPSGDKARHLVIDTSSELSSPLVAPTSPAIIRGPRWCVSRVSSRRFT